MEGPSKAEITCKDNKDGTCLVSYLPTAPGDYNIIVKFDNKHIPGSPFTAKITGGDPVFYPELCFSGLHLPEASFLSPGDDTITRTSQLNVGTSADVSLKIAETDLSSLTASIRAPSGNEEPCLLKKLPNRHLGETTTSTMSHRRDERFRWCEKIRSSRLLLSQASLSLPRRSASTK